jgi:membrane-associated phospholipid phosphatase
MMERGGSVTAAGIDGGLYTDITSFARDTRWLNGALNVYTTLSFVLLGLLLAAAWWTARRESPAATGRLLAIVVGVGVSVAANAGLKLLVDERRPCLTLPRAYTVDVCPGPTDYSFPSNHAALAGALAAGVFLLHRRLGIIAAGLALLEGFTRVYLGVHYPHDAVVGLLLGAAVTTLMVWLYGLRSRTVRSKTEGRERTFPLTPHGALSRQKPPS